MRVVVCHPEEPRLRVGVDVFFGFDDTIECLLGREVGGITTRRACVGRSQTRVDRRLDQGRVVLRGHCGERTAAPGPERLPGLEGRRRDVVAGAPFVAIRVGDVGAVEYTVVLGKGRPIREVTLERGFVHVDQIKISPEVVKDLFKGYNFNIIIDLQIPRLAHAPGSRIGEEDQVLCVLSQSCGIAQSGFAVRRTARLEQRHNSLLAHIWGRS